ncbi:hypothetical protein NPIL_168771 [Nephila pilipes]|uniref:Uncharacterized protein n=1 Tax=Nephila pilipes TaxID=299642 RepID=A0A8X6TRB9_NEPPI|nr:hypothetical protein NPIL_168771 [Nephila pilipes]
MAAGGLLAGFCENTFSDSQLRRIMLKPIVNPWQNSYSTPQDVLVPDPDVLSTGKRRNFDDRKHVEKKTNVTVVSRRTLYFAKVWNTLRCDVMETKILPVP